MNLVLRLCEFLIKTKCSNCGHNYFFHKSGKKCNICNCEVFEKSK